jgi:pilus assembly protein FimV
VYFSIIKKIAIVLFLMGLPVSALAVGLGSIAITSSLGEPLKASIALVSVTPAELASLKAKLDSEQAYAAQGLTRLAVHDEIELGIIQDAGNNSLVLTSSSPILESVLDLLVVAEWTNGRVTRQYTLQLNPGYQSNTIQIQAPTINTLDDNVIKIPDLDDRSEALTSSSIIVENHVTKKGDTLYKIARSMQPPGVSLDQVLVAIFEANPEAFDANNMNRLKVGKILQAPSQKVLSRMTAEYAYQEIKLQTADWNRYRNKLAEAALQKTASISNADAQSTSGKIKSATEEQSNYKNATKDVVKLSTADIDQLETNADAKIIALQEEMSAREKALKEAEERTAALEKQIEDMQKLLALKNNVMLNAQEQAAAKEMANDSESQQAEPTVSSTSELEHEIIVADSDNAAPVISPSGVEEKQPNFFYDLFERGLDKLKSLNQARLTVLIALSIFLLAVWLYFKKKGSKKLDNFKQSDITLGSLQAASMARNQDADMLATDNTAFLTDFSHRASNGVMNANDIDPIAEAEVYMAYGRETQAEEMLKDAISKEPQRYELHLKLLEMYASNNNTTAFETLAREVLTSLGADNAIWATVVEMGAKLEPSNPLYQPKQSAADRETADLAANQLNANSDAVELTKKTSEIGMPSDDSLDVSDFSDSPLAAEVDLYFSASDHTVADHDVVGRTDNTKAELVTEPHQDAMRSGAFDSREYDSPFDSNASTALDEKVTKVISNMPSLDFSTAEIKSAVMEASATTNRKDTQDQHDEVTGSIDKNATIESVDFSLDQQDNLTEMNVAQSNMFDVSGISLEMDDALSVEQNIELKSTAVEALVPVYEEVDTKLELVAAYIDMRDKDGAKELLAEVLKEGNASQRKRANQMLASLD